MHPIVKSAPLLALLALPLSARPGGTSAGIALKAPDARLEIVDRTRGEKVLELATGGPAPEGTLHLSSNTIVQVTGTQRNAMGITSLTILIPDLVGEPCVYGEGGHRPAYRHLAVGTPKLLERKRETPGDAPVDVQTARIRLGPWVRDLATQGCGPGWVFRGLIIVQARVQNVAGLETMLPPVLIRIDR